MRFAVLVFVGIRARFWIDAIPNLYYSLREC
jgi:hypothetical protein